MKNKKIQSIIYELTDSPISIIDLSGKLIIGNDDDNNDETKNHPIKLQDEVIGWIKGNSKASGIALLISYIALQEYEKKALGRETLEKYKELSILYDITEKLAANLVPKQVVQLIIDELRRLIKSDHISVMIYNEETGFCELLAASASSAYPDFKPGQGIPGRVLESGKAEIVNDVLSDSRHVISLINISSLICAPLKIHDRVIGVILLSSCDAVNYKAEDLKLLSAIAIQAAAAIENARLYDSLKDTFLTSVYTLAETIEKRDPYTGGHTKRVMIYSIAIGEKLGLSYDQLEKLKLAAILHDIGKIGVRDRILLKQEKLTQEEFEIIKNHPIYGQEVLKHIKAFKEIIPGVVCHHERYDGKGYPAGLDGENINYFARIIAVADSYDAITTDRPYRKGLSHEAAVNELKENAGSQFDPTIVDAFLKIDFKKLNLNSTDFHN